jgi:hypothetical protein
MTKVAILPIPTQQGDLSYRAIAGEKHAQGNSAGKRWTPLRHSYL